MATMQPGLTLACLQPAACMALAGLLVFHRLTASVPCRLLRYAGLRLVPAGVAGMSTLFLLGGGLLLATWPKGARG